MRSLQLSEDQGIHGKHQYVFANMCLQVLPLLWGPGLSVQNALLAVSLMFIVASSWESWCVQQLVHFFSRGWRLSSSWTLFKLLIMQEGESTDGSFLRLLALPLTVAALLFFQFLKISCVDTYLASSISVAYHSAARNFMFTTDETGFCFKPVNDQLMHYICYLRQYNNNLYSLYVHYIFTLCSLYVHYYVHYMWQILLRINIPLLLSCQWCSVV